MSDISLKLVVIDEEQILTDLECPEELLGYLKEKKIETLKLLDIVVYENETPFEAYMRAMHELNNLKYTTPAHKDIAEAILNEPSVCKFVFWLS